MSEKGFKKLTILRITKGSSELVQICWQTDKPRPLRRPTHSLNIFETVLTFLIDSSFLMAVDRDFENSNSDRKQNARITNEMIC